MTPAFDSLFDALDGVAYWTDPEGTIQGGGVRNWTTFATENGASSLKLGDLVGRNLFDQVHGERVQQAYRRLARLVLDRKRPHVGFSYRCDGPLVERQMRMTIGAITDGREPVGVLYHSQVMHERQRPWSKPFVARDGLKTTATVCGFCHKVKRGSLWTRPRLYYAEGGHSDVRLQHDICPTCEESLGAL
jgi:hypothetical protein